MPKPSVYVTRLIPQEGITYCKSECRVEINPDDRPLTRQELWKTSEDATEFSVC